MLDKGGSGSATPDTSPPLQATSWRAGFRLACAVTKRDGLEGTAVAGEIKPMVKPSAWFGQ